MVKSPPAVWETWVQSLGWKDALEKGIASHSSVLAWRIPWVEEPGRLQLFVNFILKVFLANFKQFYILY